MAASAQEPVQVDPDSPAGVEYKLPLEQARRDGAPDPGDGGAGLGPAGDQAVEPGPRRPSSARGSLGADRKAAATGTPKALRARATESAVSDLTGSAVSNQKTVPTRV
jgi:hypothetical protein